MLHVQQIASAPHPVGSAEHDRVRDYIVEELTKLNAAPQKLSATGVNRFGGEVSAAPVTNIIGHIAGSASTGALLLTSHYDTVERAPGAGDDGAGVATILEALRALRAGPALKNDVYVLITDGEELGLLGAKAFVGSPPPWFGDVKTVLNFDNRGDRSPVLLFETSDANHDLVSAFSKAAQSPMGSSLAYAIYQRMPNDTDFTVLRGAGKSGLNFAMISHFEAYHTRLDTPRNLAGRALQHSGGYALGLAQYLGNSDLKRPMKSHSDVFFNIIGAVFVHYSVTWVLPLWAAVTLLLFFTLAGRIRAEHYSVADVIKGFAAAISALLLTPVAVLIIGWLQRHIIGTQLTFGDTPSNTLLVLSYALAALGVFAATFRFFRGTTSLGAVSGGAVLLFWVATTVVTFTFASASYLLFWPLTCACVALALGTRTASWISAVPAVLLASPVLYMLFVLLGLNLAMYVALAAVISLFCLLLLSLWDVLVPESPLMLGVIFGFAVLAFVDGTWQSKPSANHPNPDSLSYAFNADEQKAIWYSFDDEADEWMKSYLGARPHRALVSNFIGVRQPVMVNAAPPMDAKAPEIQVQSGAQGDGTNMLVISVRSQRSASRVIVQVPDSELIDAEIAGTTVPAQDRKNSEKERVVFRLTGFYASTVIKAHVRMRGTCKIWVADQSAGLPSFGDGKFPPRPENDMAWYGSDLTTVAKTVNSCG